MCDQTEIKYEDGEVVWVKLGSCWWPGEVVGPDKLPDDILRSFRKQPIAVVQFFQETTYEYVKNINCIYKYECSKKHEFIKKGLDMYRSKHGLMEKFPEDVIHAERATGGDIEILTRDEFQETKKESYAGLFGNKKTPSIAKKGKQKTSAAITPAKLTTPNNKFNKRNSDYKAHILVQTSKDTPAQSVASNNQTQESSENNSETVVTPSKPVIPSLSSTPSTSSSGMYSCPSCNFTTIRLNVMILHNKSHSNTYVPYTPSPRKVIPSTSSSVNKSVKSTPKTSKSPKTNPKPRKEKTPSKPKVPAKKRTAEAAKDEAEAKKPKTDKEIKTSLLADWDDGDEESVETSSPVPPSGSPEIPDGASSPAIPLPKEPTVQQEVTQVINEKKTTEKPESSSDSKYEFCEDEDWPIEKEERIIPRMKNPSARKENTKSLSIDEDEVAKEVAELLNKTSVPELPSVPKLLSVEQNFPEPSIVKSPDKPPNKVPEVNMPTKDPETPPTKTIFKTKTFFRSRHSRSQDAIGKYVAEQLNAAERMDTTECDLNGSEVTSSPEMRDSPPLEPVKVARLAPKIQLKKMKAEAEQKEKERLAELQAESMASTASNQKEPEMPNTTLNISNNDNDTKSMISSDYDPTKPGISHNNVQAEPIMTETTASAVDALLSVSRESDRVTKVVSHGPPEDLFEDDAKNDSSNSFSNGVQEMELSSQQNNDTTNQHNDDIPILNEGNDIQSIIENVDNVMEVDATKEEDTQIVQETIPFEYSKLTESDLQTVETNSHNNIEPVPDTSDMSSQTTEVQNPDSNTDVITEVLENNKDVPETVTDNNTKFTDNLVSHEPSESDLQIAEALINLPSTSMKSADVIEKIKSSIFTKENENRFKENNLVITQDLDAYFNTEVQVPQNTEVNQRFESEQEISENFNAAQSLVQMSVAIDHTIKSSQISDQNNQIDSNPSVLPGPVVNKAIDNGENNNKTVKSAPLSKDKIIEDLNQKLSNSESTSKLLKILEEPKAPKIVVNKSKQLVANTPGKEKILNFDTPIKEKILNYDTPVKEKILNFDVGNSKPQPPKQKIIIRRTLPNKNLNNLSAPPKGEQVILSCKKPADESSGIQTYTIKTTSSSVAESNKTIVIQQKFQKTPTKVQQSIPQTLILPTEPKTPTKTISNDMFDINSMPMVLSDDILTPENIEKMPILMSDGNIIQNPTVSTSAIVKTAKPKVILESEKIPITQVTSGKPEPKTLVKSVPETPKATSTPNILSKAKVRAGNNKPLLIIDKATGKQKFIMRKPEPTVNEVKGIVKQVKHVATKPSPATSTGKSEKFIIIPPPNSPRPGRMQKIVIDPQTGKAHVVVTKTSDSQQSSTTENKPVSAKLVPSAPDGSNPGGTVMIITNAQGTQSRIVLTPEHEKLLFPNKQINSSTVVKTQRPKASQLIVQQKPVVVTSSTPIITQVTPKPQTKIVPKPKLTNAIITSKGQLIVGGNAAPTVSTAQSYSSTTVVDKITTPKRIIQPEFKKTIRTIKKTTPEPLIFLQQKNGTVMQLTTAQFEHLQRTGQFIQKVPATTPQVKENRVIIQKSVTIPPNETFVPQTQKQQRVRSAKPATTVPAKRSKKEIKLLPTPSPSVPALAPLSYHTTVTSVGPPVANTVSITTTPASPQLDNFEELLPSTAIARQPHRTQEPIIETIVQSHSVPQFEPQLDIAPQIESIPRPTQELIHHDQSVVQEEMIQEQMMDQQIGDGQGITDGQLVAVPGENLGGPMGTFFLCLEDNGTWTPIDNRPLILENNELVPMPEQVILAQPERRDILEAALVNSDVFHEPPRDDAPDFRDLNANVSVHCSVSETSTTLNQPIMTPVEVPSNVDSEPAVTTNLEDGLAVIGVTPHTVPTSLELPITVTDPRIAPKTTDPLSNSAYATTLIPSPGAELPYVSAEETCGPISMPLLEEDNVGKSMPILTDDLTERGVSSVESGVGSPSSLEVASSAEEGTGNGWARRLLTPGSDSSSELSVELPLQPALQISLNELTRNS